MGSNDKDSVSFESADGAASFTCPACGESVLIEGRHQPYHEWESPLNGLLWQVEQVPVACDCGKQFLASWERHVDVTVEAVDDTNNEACTIAEGRY